MGRVQFSSERVLRFRNGALPSAAHAASEREQFGYALETLDEDVQSCLAEWGRGDAGPSGQVMLAIQIDPSGLQNAWVEHDGGLPLGPRSCLTNAVYGIEWAHMVKSPVEVTRPYDLGADAGE